MCNGSAATWPSLRYLTYDTASAGIISGPDRLKFYLLKGRSLNVGKGCELFVTGKTFCHHLTNRVKGYPISMGSKGLSGWKGRAVKG